jgi:dephospho-CoA kinase
VLTGMPGSGKEEFVKIAKEQGFMVVRMGDVVRKEVKSQGLEATDDTVGGFAAFEREKFGMGIWAQRTVPLVKGDLVLIDGLRGEAELDEFRSAFGDDLILIGIHASPKTRFERIKKRNREDATASWEAFKKRELRELSWGIGNAIAQCDHVVINEKGLSEFQIDVRNLLKTLKSG